MITAAVKDAVRQLNKYCSSVCCDKSAPTKENTMHSHLAKMIGQYILDQRTKKGILQKELAEEVEISAQFLGRIERGEVMIPEPVLIACINFLSLSEKKMVQIYRAAGGMSVQTLFLQSKKSRSKKSRRA